MATLAIHRSPYVAGMPQAPEAPQEAPTFLETTIRVSTVMTALYYASLATWAHPVLGITCFAASAIVTYSKVSGIPVQDLIDNICDRCIPVQPVREQLISRIVHPIFVPASPGSIHGVLSFPVTIREVIRSNSPEPTPRSPSPELATSLPSNPITTASPTTLKPTYPAETPSDRREFVVVGALPDTTGFVHQPLFNSAYLGRSSTSSSSTN